ncbi:3-phosphoshikimate 1-carboxyvinyltransferase [Enterococcus thailandicus]|uniref:3-phosphoshikimate 1-carboxyvinyltransferase n=1 Tax=Enterococcus TaxID=1350 RepID=UPI00094C3A0F|nr:3-phosphoshikimate 1-carboxyvinyltransferase [Enterococcus thailandicus]GMC07973.1 3-phosphoshikimate 1-carboxyvinyltransferase [Enterococcus thailandicus]
MKLLTNQTKLRGTLQVPADKSISHRSVMFGAISYGETVIHNFLRAQDCLSTLQLFRNLGVEITEEIDQTIRINGKGIEGLRPSSSPLDCGNSGTTVRLVSGILAGAAFSSTLIGDASLSKRPMNRIIDPLTQMNARITGATEKGLLPLKIDQTNQLIPITYEMPVASAQVKSAILFGSLQAEGTTTIIEKTPSRNHTEEMIQQFGGRIQQSGKEITLVGPQKLTGCEVNIPGDISSAAFFIVAGLLCPESEITLKNVGINPTRTGILDVVKQMNGQIKLTEEDSVNQSATIQVKTSELQGIEIGGAIIPRLIDELPVIALLATQAKGTTRIYDAEELKVKETNRIDAVATELTKLGANIQATEDGLIIEGPTPLRVFQKKQQVSSHNDHRIGMMLQIAALLVETGEIELAEAEAVAISYPQFFGDLAKLVQGTSNE